MCPKWLNQPADSASKLAPLSGDPSGAIAINNLWFIVLIKQQLHIIYSYLALEVPKNVPNLKTLVVYLPCELESIL